jgi:hypothetical protein
LPAGSPRLDSLRARAADLQAQQTRYSQGVASGDIIPDAHLREARPRHLEELAALTRSFEQAAAEKDPDKREALSKALFAALQPVGSLLEYQDPGQGHINRIPEQQQAELERLEAAWLDAETAHRNDTAPILPLGPGQFYTLTHLSVPLAVKGPPEATVLFHTHGGGLFPNNLPIISVQADENGIARTEWFTKGDAIAGNTISVRSPAGPAVGEFGITIVQLMLRDLPAAPAAAAPAAGAMTNAQ